LHSTFNWFTFFQQANAQKIVTVSKLKPANFTTIQAAFDAVSANNTQPITIKVGNGIYYEKLVLDTRKILLHSLAKIKTAPLLLITIMQDKC
jgi:pectin methylesterase-like acyl-CoA thioesterase